MHRLNRKIEALLSFLVQLYELIQIDFIDKNKKTKCIRYI